MKKPENDQVAWAAALQDTRPLPGRRRPAIPAPALEKDAPVSPVAASPRPAVPRVGLDPHQHRAIRRGRQAIAATLDLHGLTLPRARQEIADFIPQQQGRGARLLLIITGKGTHRPDGGRLAAALPGWLAAPALAPLISHYAPARPEHGGNGAFYVWLRSRHGKRD